MIKPWIKSLNKLEPCLEPIIESKYYKEINERSLKIEGFLDELNMEKYINYLKHINKVVRDRNNYFDKKGTI